MQNREDLDRFRPWGSFRRRKWSLPPPLSVSLNQLIREKRRSDDGKLQVLKIIGLTSQITRFLWANLPTKSNPITDKQVSTLSVLYLKKTGSAPKRSNHEMTCSGLCMLGPINAHHLESHLDFHPRCPRHCRHWSDDYGMSHHECTRYDPYHFLQSVFSKTSCRTLQTSYKDLP